jgi:hypothetical protein
VKRRYELERITPSDAGDRMNCLPQADVSLARSIQGRKRIHNASSLRAEWSGSASVKCLRDGASRNELGLWRFYFLL